MNHSKFPPSSAYRWLNCTSSIKAIECANLPYQPNTYADEGTKAHELSEKLLKGETYDIHDYPKEMQNYCDNYVKYINSLKTIENHIEQKVYLLDKNVFGTADFIGVDKDKILHIVDLKYGQGVKVSAKNNTQLMIYAIGGFIKLDLKEIKHIRLHIYQPRANNINSWDLSIDDLYKFYEELKYKVNKILKGDTEFKPSNEACIFCPIKNNCKANYDFTIKEVIGLFNNANLISNDDIKIILDNEKLITSLLSSIKEEAYNRLVKGENIQGYGLTTKLSNRTISDKGIEMLYDKFGDNAFIKKPKTIKDLTILAKENNLNINELGIFEERKENIIIAKTEDNEPLKLFNKL